jgi:hypothetical protein
MHCCWLVVLVLGNLGTLVPVGTSDARLSLWYLILPGLSYWYITHWFVCCTVWLDCFFRLLVRLIVYEWGSFADLLGLLLICGELLCLTPFFWFIGSLLSLLVCLL